MAAMHRRRVCLNVKVSPVFELGKSRLIHVEGLRKFMLCNAQGVRSYSSARLFFFFWFYVGVFFCD